MNENTNYTIVHKTFSAIEISSMSTDDVNV